MDKHQRDENRFKCIYIEREKGSNIPSHLIWNTSNQCLSADKAMGYNNKLYKQNAHAHGHVSILSLKHVYAVGKTTSSL